jgi:hypothetical protein
MDALDRFEFGEAHALLHEQVSGTTGGSRLNKKRENYITPAWKVGVHRRVTTLKALIRINSFSSALAGLIKTIMSDICLGTSFPES